MRRFLFMLAVVGLSAPQWAMAEVLTLRPAALVPGQCLVREWERQGRPPRLPIRVCRRTPAQMKALAKASGKPDPLLLQSLSIHAQGWADSHLPSQMLAMRRLDSTASRSLRPEYFVAIDLEPYIGCQLQAGDYSRDALPFRNPCHANTFDANGRPAPGGDVPFPLLFMDIPPHLWRGDTLVIGEMPADLPWLAYDFRPLDREEPTSRQALNAVRWGDVPRLEALVEAGKLDVNAIPETHAPTSLLFEAVSHRQRAVVRWLLDHGADASYVTPLGTTLMDVARLVGDPEVLAWLAAPAAEGGKAAPGGTPE